MCVPWLAAACYLSSLESVGTQKKIGSKFLDEAGFSKVKTYFKTDTVWPLKKA